jgi:hypothetical protein
VTCIKPEGTLGLISGTTPGIHYPIGHHMIRRIRIRKSAKVAKDLIANGVPHEEDIYDDTSYVFEFPMKIGENVRTVDKVDIIEQLMVNKTVQTFWADNNVSFTGYFEKGRNISNIIGLTLPYIKTMSLLPVSYGTSDEEPYEQMPYENITEQEYKDRLADLDCNF